MKPSARRSLAGIAAVLAVAALAAAVASGAFAGSRSMPRLASSSPAAATSTPAPTDPSGPPASGNVGIAVAERVAARAAGGRVVAAALDGQAPTATYQVTVHRADGSDVDVTVDGRTGRLLSQSRDGGDTADQPRPTDTADTAEGTSGDVTPGS